MTNMWGVSNILHFIKKKWIVEISSDQPRMERKRMYELTGEGRQVLEDELARLRRLLDSADIVLDEV